MATSSTRIMVRSSNRDWSSPTTKAVLQNQPQTTSKVATVKPVSKTMSITNGPDINGFGANSDDEKRPSVAVTPSRKDSEKDALVVELEKCLTELENDQGSHATLAHDYSKIEKEKDDLLSELEVTFQELEEYMAHVKELEAEKKEIVDERDELTAQVEYLKYCLSGRQEIQDQQQSGWKDKKLELEEQIKDLKERNEILQEEMDALYEERQSLIHSLLNLNSEKVNEVIKTRSRSSSTVSTDSSASFFLRGENEELAKYLKDAEEAEERALGELQESKVHIMALKQTIVDQEHEISELVVANEELTLKLDSQGGPYSPSDDEASKAALKEIEDLKSELESLQKDLASKRALLHSQSQQEKKEQDRINNLESLANVRSEEIMSLKEELKDKCSELETSERNQWAEKNESASQIKKLEEDKLTLDIKLKEANSAAGQLKLSLDDVNKLNQEVSRLKGLIAVAEDKVDRLTSDNASARNALKEIEAEKQKLQTCYDELKSENEQTCNELSSKSAENKKLVQTNNGLQLDTEKMIRELEGAKKETEELSSSLHNTKSHNEKLSDDNKQLNKSILENHKQKIEALENLLESERKKVKGFDESVEALRLQVEGDKNQMDELRQDNERLTSTMNTIRLDNTKLKEQAKRQRMTSNSVQELVQHKLREEKQSLEKRCEALQSALDKANAENKCVLQQLDEVNESTTSTIRNLKAKKNELQLEHDALKQKHAKNQEDLVAMKKEIDTYENFNQIHVDRKLEAAAPGSSLLERLQSSEDKLRNASTRISQLEADGIEYPRKLEESETLINDLQRALSHANDLAMEKSLEVSRSKRNLEKKMEKILKENIDLKRKLFVEGASHTSSVSSATPFHSRNQMETSQSAMYEPKNDQRMGFSSAVDKRRIDAPAVIKKTELMTVAQLASPPLQQRDADGRQRTLSTQGSVSSDGSPRSQRSSTGLIQERRVSDTRQPSSTRRPSDTRPSDNNFLTPKSSQEAPPVKPPPPAFYEARLKKTSSKRDTPHPDKMHHHRTQLSLDGSMDEIAAKKLLGGSNKPLQGGRLEHWV